MTTICKICGEKKAVPQHIKSHGLTYDEYLKEYEPETYLNKALIEKINDLYVIPRYRFLEMDSTGRYMTIERGKNRKYGLTDADVKAHLEGQKTIGVFFPKRYTKFVCFDVDTKDAEVLERTYNAINQYLPEESILVSDSGSKGFHIDVFFKNLITWEMVTKFYEVILADTGFTEQQVEVRGNSAQGVKIPLGLNFKNKDIVGQYCAICNEYGIRATDGMETFLNRQKADTGALKDAIDINHTPQYLKDDEIIEFDEIIGEYKGLDIYNHTIDTKRQKIEQLIDEGLTLKGTRHHSMFGIAVYNKDQGLTEAENRDFLMDWIKRQDRSLYSSNMDDIRVEVGNMLNTIYAKGYRLKVNRRDITLTKGEIKEILSVKGKALRRVYFILYVHSKAFKGKDGVFYMTYEQMGNAGANDSDRRHLRGLLDKLENAGKLEIVASGVQHKPNRYRILAQVEAETVRVFHLCDRNCKNCFEVACKYMLEDDEIRQAYGKNRVSEIMSLKCNEQ